MFETSTFPVDDVTLELLLAACRINPDSGHTELMTFWIPARGLEF